MALKVMVKELRTLLGDARSMLVTFAAPFLFRLLPGFNGSAFPAILIAYVILGLFSTRADNASIRTGVTQFPVTVRDHVVGMFLYQAVAVLATALLAIAFMQIAGPDKFMTDIVPKALGIGLLLTGLLTAMGLWLRPEVARVLSMLVIILVLNFVIFQSDKGPVFLPWLSVPADLLGGLGGWLGFLALGLLNPPRL